MTRNQIKEWEQSILYGVFVTETGNINNKTMQGVIFLTSEQSIQLTLLYKRKVQLMESKSAVFFFFFNT